MHKEGLNLTVLAAFTLAAVAVAVTASVHAVRDDTVAVAAQLSHSNPVLRRGAKENVKMQNSKSYANVGQVGGYDKTRGPDIPVKSSKSYNCQKSGKKSGKKSSKKSGKKSSKRSNCKSPKPIPPPPPSSTTRLYTFSYAATRSSSSSVVASTGVAYYSLAQSTLSSQISSATDAVTIKTYVYSSTPSSSVQDSTTSSSSIPVSTVSSIINVDSIAAPSSSIPVSTTSSSTSSETSSATPSSSIPDSTTPSSTEESSTTLETKATPSSSSTKSSTEVSTLGLPNLFARDQAAPSAVATGAGSDSNVALGAASKLGGSLIYSVVAAVGVLALYI